MIDAIIIEDEKPAARRLQRMLTKYNVKVQTALHGVEEAVQWFEHNSAPHLIFLDIQLSDGLCFEIFEKVKIETPVIFTTAYDEYALQAFKLNSIDYLLKPIDETELQAALKKYERTNNITESLVNLKHLKAYLNLDTTAYKKRFSVQVGQHLKLIEIEEVCYFCSENKATFLHTESNRSFLLESSLDKIELELDPEAFFRVNRKFIIALKSIVDILTYSNTRLEVKLKGYEGEQIIVSRERVKAFKEWLE